MESVRDGEKVFQKTLMSLGWCKDDQELEVLKETASKFVFILENPYPVQPTKIVRTFRPFKDPRVQKESKIQVFIPLLVVVTLLGGVV